jgi:hypothetical protein
VRLIDNVLERIHDMSTDFQLLRVTGIGVFEYGCEITPSVQVAASKLLQPT